MFVICPQVPEPDENMVTPQMQAALRSAKYTAAKKDMDEKKSGKKTRKGGVLKRRLSKMRVISRRGKKHAKKVDGGWDEAWDAADTAASSGDQPCADDHPHEDDEQEAWEDETPKREPKSLGKPKAKAKAKAKATAKAKAKAKAKATF